MGYGKPIVCAPLFLSGFTMKTLSENSVSNCGVHRELTDTPARSIGLPYALNR